MTDCLPRPEEALDAGGDSTPLYHLPGGGGGGGGGAGHHNSLQDNIANISGGAPSHHGKRTS